MTNEIIILDDKKTITALELFTPNGIDKILADIKAKAKEFEPDMTTEEGRKAIASMAYKIARTKTALDSEGKKLTEDWAKQKALVDSERKRVREELDSLRDEIRAPLNEWEDKEEARINERKERIIKIEELKQFSCGDSLENVQNAIKALKALIEFDWQEFGVKAKNCHDESLQHLLKAEDQIKATLAEKEELEKLRKEKEERERKEREAQIAKDAAEKAKRDAEARALAEKQRVEQEAKAREAKIEADKKAAEQAKVDAEKRAKDAENKARIAAAKATTLERQKVAAQKAAEEKAAAEREADKEHHAKINNEALEAISQYIPSHGADEYAKEVLKAIVKGKIPHVSIKY